MQYASPATVSRCGMVYVDPKNLGYNPFWKKWVNSRNSKQEKDWLGQLYDKYVPSCIDMIIEGVVDAKQGEKMKTITPLTNLNLVSLGGECRSGVGRQVEMQVNAWKVYVNAAVLRCT